MVKRNKQNVRQKVSCASTLQTDTMKKTGVVQKYLPGVKCEPHLMIYRGLGQRRDCKGEEPAVAVFIHNFLWKQNSCVGKGIHSYLHNRV